MNVIFKDLDVEALIKKIRNNNFFVKAFKIANKNKISVKIASFSLIGILAVVITIAATGVTFGFNVKYSGNVIATVRNVSVIESARDIVVKNVSSEGADKAISAPKLTLTITVADRLDSANKVADAIIENTGDIVEASALVVDGEVVACTQSGELSSLVESRRTAYFIDGAQNSAVFVADVKIEKGYYLKSDIKDISAITDIIENLEVKTVSTVVTDTQVNYGTKNVKTNKQVMGYYKVTTKGQNGITRKTETVESLNGSETSRKTISSEVISQPVDQVITIGTAPVKISATEKANISSAGFICPIKRGNFVISSYYGDGRNHKGIDLAANRGIAIFAAASGTVTYAGYDGDYGYSVVIDHGNGMKTRYAHANALCVSKGQTVSQGDMIATVGNTGYSTGNHLHFEIIINGTRVNPAPYIGLN